MLFNKNNLLVLYSLIDKNGVNIFMIITLNYMNGTISLCAHFYITFLKDFI